MKLAISLCLLALAHAASKGDVQITRYYNNNDGRGNFRWGFEQTDGQRHEQQGELKNAGRDNEIISVRGEYSWVGPDGVNYIVTYIADDNGFQSTITDQSELTDKITGGLPEQVIRSLLGG